VQIYNLNTNISSMWKAFSLYLLFHFQLFSTFFFFSSLLILHSPSLILPFLQLHYVGTRFQCNFILFSNILRNNSKTIEDGKLPMQRIEAHIRLDKPITDSRLTGIVTLQTILAPLRCTQWSRQKETNEKRRGKNLIVNNEAVEMSDNV
jgi:hypothetical protein